MLCDDHTLSLDLSIRTFLTYRLQSFSYMLSLNLHFDKVSVNLHSSLMTIDTQILSPYEYEHDRVFHNPNMCILLLIQVHISPNYS